MKKKRLLYLEKYGHSLTAVAKLYNHKPQVRIADEIIAEPKGNFYMCPLCMKNFCYLLEDQYYETEQFTEDHYPPESEGGTKTILVCKPCNDNSGIKVDHVLKTYLNHRHF